MDTKFQTSFIPRKPLVPNSSAVPPQNSGSSSGGLLNLIGIVIFVASVASAIGIFAWNKIEMGNIEKNKAALAENRKQFGSDIEFLKKFNTRINLAKRVVDNHTATSNVLKALEEVVVDNVRFKEFTFEMADNPSADTTRFEIDGEAKTFEALAFQSDTLLESTKIKNPVISDLKLNDKGLVEFKLIGTLPFSELRYAKQFETVETPTNQNE